VMLFWMKMGGCQKYAKMGHPMAMTRHNVIITRAPHLTFWLDIVR
jgi:hypothetical protein